MWGKRAPKAFLVCDGGSKEAPVATIRRTTKKVQQFSYLRKILQWWDSTAKTAQLSSGVKFGFQLTCDCEWFGHLVLCQVQVQVRASNVHMKSVSFPCCHRAMSPKRIGCSCRWVRVNSNKLESLSFDILTRFTGEIVQKIKSIHEFNTEKRNVETILSVPQWNGMNFNEWYYCHRFVR